MGKTTTLQDIAEQIQLILVAVMQNKPVMNIKETSIYTGLAESYLYKLTSRQEIPHFKPRGKMVYFNKIELDEWLQRNRVKSNLEIEQEAVDHINGDAS